VQIELSRGGADRNWIPAFAGMTAVVGHGRVQKLDVIPAKAGIQF